MIDSYVLRDVIDIENHIDPGPVLSGYYQEYYKIEVTNVEVNNWSCLLKWAKYVKKLGSHHQGKDLDDLASWTTIGWEDLRHWL